MATRKKLTMNRIIRAIERDNLEGFCLACGSTVRPVEPDARKYVCPKCKQPKVYGAEEILMMCGG